MRTLLISPHFDDAVLSAGQFMAGKKGKCDVLTVFSEVPMVSAEYLTDYDKSCGFTTSKDAVVTRQDEDEQALAILGAESRHLGLLDSQYEGSQGQDILAALEQFKKDFGSEYDMVLAPLGLMHPDHIAVSDAAHKVFWDMNLYLWEDLPHRVTYPEEVYRRLHNMGFKVVARQSIRDELENPVFIGDGPIAEKVRALWCYKSQMARGDLDPYLLYVPERFWKI